MAYKKRKWREISDALEHHIRCSSSIASYTEGNNELWQAVRDGVVRVRIAGRELSSEEAFTFTANDWMPRTDLATISPDIEVLTEDLERTWAGPNPQSRPSSKPKSRKQMDTCIKESVQEYLLDCEEKGKDPSIKGIDGWVREHRLSNRELAREELRTELENNGKAIKRGRPRKSTD